MLRNLFFNAIKFTSDGGDIRITAEVENNLMHFSLTDSGIGIPEEELLEIFEPFTQSSRTKTKAGGTGLGLSISKQIINAHHGEIWATNNATQGASFHFTVPVDQTSIKNHIITNKAANILMIDDDQICLASAEIIFSGTNLNFIPRLGGKAGLEYLKTYPAIDIILLDLMMQDIYGLDVLAEIKKDIKLAHIPVSMQTGTSDQYEIQKAYDLGIISLLKKPYDKAKLITEITQALNT